jgi:DNA-binding GntR family transcriptional regulator
MTDLSANLLAPLDRQARLGDLAYNSLKDRLVTGGFAPGDRLTVRAVAQALGVSTTPARDALNRLMADGNLVNAGPKSVVVPVLDRRVLDEITAMRLVLEGLAAETGAPQVSKGDIEHLEKLQTKINAGLDASKYSEVLKHNRDFHFLIYGLSGMPRLVVTIESLWLRIGPSLNCLYPDFAITRHGVSNHLKAIKGLKAKNAALVRNAIESDIRDGYARLSRYVAERGAVAAE